MVYVTEARHHRYGYIRAEFGIRPQGYFSVTAEVNRYLSFSERGFISGGCQHDEVRRYFPELREAVRWHLCTAGIPLHYVANALYWHDMHQGRYDRRPYDPDPVATLGQHALAEIDAADPAAWMRLERDALAALLEARTEALRAHWERFEASLPGIVTATGARVASE